MKRLTWLFVLLYLALGQFASARVLYVDKNATGPTHDGISWGTAFTTIQAAVNAAADNDEVWAAASAPAAPAYVENILVLDKRVALYGGFAGTETQRGQRDWRANPTTLDGGGVRCRSQGIVVDGFRIRNGNVEISNSMATVSNNHISNGHVYIVSSTATLSSNVISGSDVRGVEMVSGTVTLVNNIITGHRQYGVRILSGAVATLINNTITANGEHGVVVGWDSTATAALTNNIIAFNGGYGIFRNPQNPATTISGFSHNDVYGNTKGDYKGYTPPSGQGNISADPKLSNLYRDIHIQPDSPCRDAGDDTVVAQGDTDIDGQPRKQGAHVDIGSDESDGAVWTVPSMVWHVSPTGNDANDGRGWATAKKTVKGALAVAQGSDEVWVAKGTYAENYVTPGAGVALYGGFAGGETLRGQRNVRVNASILDGSGETVITCSYHNSAVDGFNIRNGNGGISVGAGMATISNNVITGNNTGAEIGGTATMLSNVISGNKYDGVSIQGYDGVYIFGMATLINNTISDNGSIGVNVSESTALLANNIVAFNGVYGVRSLRGSIPTFFYNNVFGNGTDFSGYSPPAGQGNHSVDPMFTDRANSDFHLRSKSPCVNTGDDSVVTPGSTDGDGYPRIYSSHVDIGAYEYNPFTLPFTLADVTKCLSVASGLGFGSTVDFTRLNVNAENAGLDMLDAARLARKVVGLEANP